MWRKLSVLATLAVMALPFLGAMPASALTVSPLRFEYDVKPGESIAGSVKLTNETSSKETYYPVVQDFTASQDESGTPNFLPEGVITSTSIVRWVSFDSASVSLQPNETQYVTYHIHVPETATPGGYYGGLLFSTVPPQQTSGVAVGAKVGPLVLIAVAGDVKEAGAVLDFSANPSTISSLPANFDIRFQNTGTVHLQPTGEIRITNMFGGGAAIIPVNQEGNNVLPSSVRRFETSWQKNDVGSDSAEIVKEWKNFGFGLYTATLVMHYGADNTVATASTTFWVIPWQLTILAVIAIVILVLLLRSYNRAIVRGAGKKK